MYGEGISKNSEILDLAVEFEIKKSRFWFSYVKPTWTRTRCCKSLIKDNPELADELEIKIKERIKELADA
jgi:recombination protein RecA